MAGGAVDRVLERLNGEIKGRAKVAGIFPNEAALTRLVGAIQIEQNEGTVTIC